MKFIARFLLSVLGLLLIAEFVAGIAVDGIYAASIAVLILGVLNAIVRPVLLILTLPITVITLGLFTFVINALLFMFAASFLDGFAVSGFVAAFIGSLGMAVVSTLGSYWIK
jgi:putative membrane protein